MYPPRGLTIFRQAWSSGEGWTSTSSVSQLIGEDWSGGLTPYVSGVTVQVTTLECLGNIFPHADGTSGSVYQPCAFLHLGDEVFVEQAFGTLVEWGVLSISSPP
jgi:hypothetical protein